jgi:hypothetical protein
MKTLARAIRLIKATEGGGLSKEEAKALGEKIGIDWETAEFNVDQFMAGYAEEFEEHGTSDPETNITDDSPEMTGKIAWTHLKKDPSYYDDEVEKDACDYPRTDPVMGLGSGSPEDMEQGGPSHDSLMEPKWVGRNVL